jgi:solute carrier family 13 (sodium-dependent dicarboxylate transporter), member 2/3/5
MDLKNNRKDTLNNRAKSIAGAQEIAGEIWEPKASEERRSSFIARYHYHILLLAALAGGVIAFGPRRPEGLSVEGQRALGCFIFCATLWVTNVIPLHITSIFALTLLPLLNVLSANETFTLFGNKAIFFILGAFMLSSVLVESGLSTRITCYVLGRFATTAKGLRTMILFFCAFSSLWMSEHAVAAICFPIVLKIVTSLRLYPGKSRFGTSFFFALAWGCIAGGIATYLGGARNLLAAGMLSAETGIQISFVSWATAALPLAAFVLLCAYLILEWRYPPEPVNMHAAHDVLREERKKIGPISRREIAICIIILLTIGMWVFLGTIIDLSVAALLSVGFMFVFRLTNWRKVEKGVNWGIVLMYGGAIVMGSALHKTGASLWLINSLFGNRPLSPMMIVFVLGTFSLLATEVMSNAAVVTVMLPVGLTLGRKYGVPLEVITLAIALPSGLTFTMPIGTPANAIAYSSGYPKMRDFLSNGPILSAFSLIMLMLIARFIWPLLGLWIE